MIREDQHGRDRCRAIVQQAEPAAKHRKPARSRHARQEGDAIQTSLTAEGLRHGLRQVRSFPRRRVCLDIDSRRREPRPDFDPAYPLALQRSMTYFVCSPIIGD